MFKKNYNYKVILNQVLDYYNPPAMYSTMYKKRLEHIYMLDNFNSQMVCLEIKHEGDLHVLEFMKEDIKNAKKIIKEVENVIKEG